MAFRDPAVAGEELTLSGVHSQDFSEGLAGWRIGQDGSAQFSDMLVTGQLGASVVSADRLFIGGEDINDFLSPLPLGVTAYAGINSGDHAGNTVGGTALVCFVLNAGTLLANRLYMVWYRGVLGINGPAAANEAFDVNVAYTTNGANPTAASPVLGGGKFRISPGNLATAGSGTTVYASFINFGYARFGADVPTAKFGILVQRVAGSGSAFIYQNTSQQRLDVWVVDCGAYGPEATASISQIAKGGGTVPNPSPPPPDPDPIQRYTKKYTSNWWRPFDGDGGTRQGDDDQDKMYQGYYSSTHGRTLSLFGFPYSTIMADTSGASMISATLTFKVRYRAWSSGLDVNILTHDYASKPSSWTSSHFDYSVASHANSGQGSTYNVSLGVTAANGFKSGANKGCGFHAVDNGNDQYGYMYGTSYKPVLTLVYDK